MNVLSLFDGISGAAQALKIAGKKVDKYWTSEIDKYAIKVQEYHFPSAINLGTAGYWNKWDEWGVKDVDLLIGGSPCQDLSIAGRTKGDMGLNGTRSGLFHFMVNAIKKYQPKYFLVENVVMKDKWKAKFNEALGCEPILIDSQDFTAQRRKRYYWTNIPIDPWTPKNIKLQDIVESGVPIQDKSYCIDANYFKGGPGPQLLHDYRVHGKGKRYQAIDRCLVAENGTWRKFTPLECERLQSFPDNFTDVGISNTQRYRCLGNAFTVNVVAHILKNI